MPQRLVACQGPIQLVTAVTVLRQRDRARADGLAAVWQDHLAILELAVPSGQERALVDALTGMARALRFPPPLELDVDGGLYVLIDEGPPEQWTYRFVPDAR